MLKSVEQLKSERSKLQKEQDKIQPLLNNDDLAQIEVIFNNYIDVIASAIQKSEEELKHLVYAKRFTYFSFDRSKNNHLDNIIINKLITALREKGYDVYVRFLRNSEKYYEEYNFEYKVKFKITWS